MSLTQVYVGLGSNTEREAHLCAALDALTERFGALRCSPVFESEAVGMCGGHFLNLVVDLQTQLSVAELVRCLKAIEAQCGRCDAGDGKVMLDMDVLLYGQQVGCYAGQSLPRADILYHAFVLWPLALLAPNEVHPVQQQCFSQLWQQAKLEQKIWPYALRWREQLLTPMELLVKSGKA